MMRNDGEQANTLSTTANRNAIYDYVRSAMTTSSTTTTTTTTIPHLTNSNFKAAIKIWYGVCARVCARGCVRALSSAV